MAAVPTWVELLEAAREKDAKHLARHADCSACAQGAEAVAGPQTIGITAFASLSGHPGKKPLSAAHG